MSIKKLGFMLLCALSLAALLNGCGSSSKAGGSPGDVGKSSQSGCFVCHAVSTDPLSSRNIVADFLASPHNRDEVGCQGCHGGGAEHNGIGPIPFPNPVNRCFGCHNDLLTTRDPNHTGYVNDITAPTNCTACHNAHNTLKYTDGSCIACHAFAQDATAHGTYVNDNNGVRAITTEFAKWSHHVTGVNLQNAHCAACHLEGKAGADGKIHIDTTYHMSDARTHLRNADTDADMQWDPANPNHSTMDNFCMSCHDANGANSQQSAAIRALMVPAAGKTASASNPFGDTISNRYDKMQRPAVVDASSQFNINNNSHHGVKGPRYSGRTRNAGPRQITSPGTFANNSSALLQGVRSTIYDAGNFNALYSPLGTDGSPATGLGDDSTLHCGDCHTVGQWKVASSDTANGSPTPAAIGAHGSNNEYLLRNTLGTDERHTQNAFTINAAGVVVYSNPNGAFLVCYNCHNYNKYGSIFLATGVVGGHVGEYDAQGRCNGIGNTLPFNGYTTGTATDGTQFASRFEGPVSKFGATPAFAPGFPLNGTAPAGEQNPDFGNIFGIQCANCHNSGTGNAFGGIHGSARNQNSVNQQVDPSVTGGAYIDGMGNTAKIERFLPGLGNAMHVPGTLGGITGGTQATFLRYSTNAANNAANIPATLLPVRDNTVSKKVGSYNYITGGISNDTNWEQKHWQQVPGMVINSTTGVVSGTTATAQGAGCYTLGGATTVVGQPSRDAATTALRGPSVTGAGGAATELLDTWGGCDDHNAPQGGGDHGFIKKIVRPVTY